MRALASNLEASRTFEAPFSLEFTPNVDPGHRGHPAVRDGVAHHEPAIPDPDADVTVRHIL